MYIQTTVSFNFAPDILKHGFPSEFILTTNGVKYGSINLHFNNSKKCNSEHLTASCKLSGESLEYSVGLDCVGFENPVSTVRVGVASAGLDPDVVRAAPDLEALQSIVANVSNGRITHSISPMDSPLDSDEGDFGLSDLDDNNDDVDSSNLSDNSAGDGLPYIAVPELGLFKCKLCDKMFSNKNSIWQHRRTIHENYRFACDYCSREFTRKAMLECHVRKCGNKDFALESQDMIKCRLCDTSFKSRKQLYQHKRIHPECRNVDFRIECRLCEKTFATLQAKNQHYLKCKLNNHRRRKIGSNPTKLGFLGSTKPEPLRFETAEEVKNETFPSTASSKTRKSIDGIAKGLFAKVKSVSPIEELKTEVDGESNAESGSEVPHAHIKTIQLSPINGAVSCGCGLWFATRPELLRHQRSCEKRSRNGPDLSTGKFIQLLSDGTYKCVQCTVVSPNRKYIDNHIRARHFMRYVCSYCDMLCSSTTHVKHHIPSCVNSLASKNTSITHNLEETLPSKEINIDCGFEEDNKIGLQPLVMTDETLEVSLSDINGGALNLSYVTPTSGRKIAPKVKLSPNTSSESTNAGEEATDGLYTTGTCKVSPEMAKIPKLKSERTPKVDTKNAKTVIWHHAKKGTGRYMKSYKACPKCGAGFRGVTECERHEAICTSSRPIFSYEQYKSSDGTYSCKPCEKTYRYQSGMLAHLATHHYLLYLCGYCGGRADGRKSVAMHLEECSLAPPEDPDLTLSLDQAQSMSPANDMFSSSATMVPFQRGTDLIPAPVSPASAEDSLVMDLSSSQSSVDLDNTCSDINNGEHSSPGVNQDNGHDLTLDVLNSPEKSDDNSATSLVSSPISSKSSPRVKKRKIGEVSGEVFPCSKCNMVFSSSTSRYDHRILVHVKKFQCDRCGQTFIRPYLLSAHQEKCDGTLPSILMDEPMDGDLDGIDDESTEEGGRKFPVPEWSCKECKMIFGSRQGFNNHMRVHRRTYSCSTCNTAFTSANEVHAHLKKCHLAKTEDIVSPRIKSNKVSSTKVVDENDNKNCVKENGESSTDVTYNCPFCYFDYRKVSALNAHMAQCHPE